MHQKNVVFVLCWAYKPKKKKKKAFIDPKVIIQLLLHETYKMWSIVALACTSKHNKHKQSSVIYTHKQQMINSLTSHHSSHPFARGWNSLARSSQRAFPKPNKRWWQQWLPFALFLQSWLALFHGLVVALATKKDENFWAASSLSVFLSCAVFCAEWRANWESFFMKYPKYKWKRI